MLQKEEMKLYNRQILLDNIGVEGQQKLKDSKVLVVGAGGLGSPVLRYLASAGIGEIGVIDFDKVSISNLHRQILFDFSDVNKNKALVAKEKLEKCNPFIKINAYPERLTIEIGSVLFKKYDIIVDCTDNYESRFLINDLCVLTNKPFVYGSIYRFEGQISVFNLDSGPTYRCLFKDFPTEESTTDCNSSGVLGVLPGMIGLYQANEILKMVLNIGDTLGGKLLIINGLSNSSSIFNISNKRITDYDSIIFNDQLDDKNYHRKCNFAAIHNEIEFDEFNEKYLARQIQIIDVREENEFPIIENTNLLHIPFTEINERLNEINPILEIVVFCKSGKRSLKAIEIIKEKFNHANIKSFKDGLTDELLFLLEN
jgi:molybdopterin/thiamine biosynthesis adenylyltransferase/rhodanese-related sulfurtransferase